MSRGGSLRAVGFWRQSGNRQLPRPGWLVRPDWRPDERARIAAYLASGHVFAGWLGYSYCRFRCGIQDVRMGTRDFTDGVWVWPEGLAHYVLEHDIELPDEFVSTMRANGWRVPLHAAVPEVEDERVRVDLEFWQSWARRRRPWYAIW